MERRRDGSLADRHFAFADTFDLEGLWLRRTSPPGTWETDRALAARLPKEELAASSALARQSACEIAAVSLMRANTAYGEQDDRKSHLARQAEAARISEALKRFLKGCGFDRRLYGDLEDEHDVLGFGQVEMDVQQRDKLLRHALGLIDSLETFAKERDALPRGTREDKLSTYFIDSFLGFWPQGFGCAGITSKEARAEIALAVWKDVGFPLPDERSAAGNDLIWMDDLLEKKG